MVGINGWEFILLIVLAVVILGPERLPEYAAKLARGIHRLRVMAEGAKGQLRDQLGDDYRDIDWKQYDPRQYDPRRIVKQALLDPLDDVLHLDTGVSGTDGVAGVETVAAASVPVAVDPRVWDPARTTPWDSDAT